MQDIADEAEVDKALVHYYRSKEKLFTLLQMILGMNEIEYKVMFTERVDSLADFLIRGIHP